MPTMEVNSINWILLSSVFRLETRGFPVTAATRADGKVGDDVPKDLRVDDRVGVDGQDDLPVEAEEGVV